MMIPPSTLNDCPAMLRTQGEARNTASAATSGSLGRPRGMAALRRCSGFSDDEIEGALIHYARHAAPAVPKDDGERALVERHGLDEARRLLDAADLAFGRLPRPLQKEILDHVGWAPWLLELAARPGRSMLAAVEEIEKRRAKGELDPASTERLYRAAYGR